MSGSSWTGRLVSAAVVVLVAALAAATFILSYAGVRDLAVAAGVPLHLARLYPAILDGVLVVACAAAFMLRDSSVWRRIYAWFAVAVLVAVIGAADAIHAMDVVLPKRPAAGTVAALPWALVMLGFSLWLTMLRHSRAPRRAAEPMQYQATSYPALEPAPLPPDVSARGVSRAGVSGSGVSTPPLLEATGPKPASPWWAGHPDAEPEQADVVAPEADAQAVDAEAASDAEAAHAAAPDAAQPEAAGPAAAAAAPEAEAVAPEAEAPEAQAPEAGADAARADADAAAGDASSDVEDAAAAESAAPAEATDESEADADSEAVTEPGKTTPDDTAVSNGEKSEDTDAPGFRLYRVRSTPVPPQD
jgi:hypothetical protein